MKKTPRTLVSWSGAIVMLMVLAATAADLKLLAEYEGLTAHRDSALIRLK